MSGPYTLKIYAALPGTPLLDEHGKPKGTSAAGHIWYEVNDGQGRANSYGFAPKHHGSMIGPGQGVRSDTSEYVLPRYTRTLEITATQYAKLRQFGEAAVDENWHYFKGDYDGATNSCVDFTWGALKHAGLEIHRPEIRSRDGQVVLGREYKGPVESGFDGRVTPGHNKVDMQQIVAPVPNSPHNHWHENPPPQEATFFQKLISENGQSQPPGQSVVSPGPKQAEHAQRFKDQLGAKLGQLGMNEQQIDTLSAAAAKEATRHAGQGEVGHFLLSRDGSAIALQQNFPPLREFSVADALARRPAEHWREAVALNRDTSAEIRSENGGHGLVTPGFAQPAPEHRAMA